MLKVLFVIAPQPSAALHGAVSTVKRWPIYGKWRHLLCFCHIREISDTKTNSCRKIAGKIFHGCFWFQHHFLLHLDCKASRCTFFSLIKCKRLEISYLYSIVVFIATKSFHAQEPGPHAHNILFNIVKESFALTFEGHSVHILGVQKNVILVLLTAISAGVVRQILAS